MKKISIEVNNCFECPYFSYSKWCDVEIGLISCFCRLSEILPKFETLNLDYDTCDHEIHIQCPLRLSEVDICLIK